MATQDENAHCHWLLWDNTDQTTRYCRSTAHLLGNPPLCWQHRKMREKQAQKKNPKKDKEDDDDDGDNKEEKERKKKDRNLREAKYYLGLAVDRLLASKSQAPASTATATPTTKTRCIPLDVLAREASGKAPIRAEVSPNVNGGGRRYEGTNIVSRGLIVTDLWMAYERATDPRRPEPKKIGSFG